MKRPWHTLTKEEVLKALETSLSGLSEEEARERLSRFGLNELEEVKTTPAWKIFLDQFKSILIVILLIAAVVSYFLGEKLDAVVISVIVFACAILGFIQEWRADRAVAALRAMATPEATVRRGGHEKKIPAREVVPGDILILAAGDKIAADARLLEAINLRVDEAPLTGESVPVEKKAEEVLPEEVSIGDRRNMVFAATTVTYGRGVAVVVATGKETEFGRIAGMIQAIEEEKTPLEERLAVIGRWLGGISLVICALATVIGVAKGYSWLDMFIWGVSLAVAAVPEALPAVVTGALAIGVSRMAKHHAIVKRLPAVETLGCTTVICTDKTGTLTKNEMTVREIYADEKVFQVEGSGYAPEGRLLLGQVPVSPEPETPLWWTLLVGLLCNDAHLEEQDGQVKVVGDPTEAALLVSALKAGLSREGFTRLDEIPFDSERKLMTVVVKEKGGRLFVLTKGATEQVLSRCAYFLVGGRIKPLEDRDRSLIRKYTEEMASRALRVMAFAYKEIGPDYDRGHLEEGLVFCGLQGMIDPPREEAKEAIRECQAAGIRVIMITGDHPLTASAIAKELGLISKPSPEMVMIGQEVEKIDDETLKLRLKKVVVFARVSPEHKLRIVNALRALNEVVAVTGDGVNDAPALKQADIGVAMGITGTEVAKEAAAMILTDDNFATIVKAVREGRAIYDNIKKYLLYLLSANIAEIIVLTSAFFFGLPVPLLAIQILWINLLTDGPPALALGVDPPAPDLMKRPPRPPGESVFTPRMTILIAMIALTISLVLLPFFNYYIKANPEGLPSDVLVVKARTLLLIGFVLIEMVAAYCSRSDHLSLFKIGPFSNRWLNWAVIGEVILMAVMIEIDQFRPIIKAYPVPLSEWLLLIGLGLLLLPISEGTKWVLNRLKVR